MSGTQNATLDVLEDDEDDIDPNAIQSRGETNTELNPPAENDKVVDAAEEPAQPTEQPKEGAETQEPEQPAEKLAEQGQVATPANESVDLAMDDDEDEADIDINRISSRRQSKAA